MDKTVRLWDLRSGKCVSCLRSHTDEVLDVAFSPDSIFAASGAADGKACLYDLRKLDIQQPELYGETMSSSYAETMAKFLKSWRLHVQINFEVKFEL